MRATQAKRRVNRELGDVLAAVDKLPTMPVVAQKVGSMVHDPKSDAQQIARVMRGDPALTTKVLRLVNSPYFAIPGGVSDIGRAISFIGFNTLHQLVLTASVFKMLGRRRSDTARHLFRHSLGVACAAEAVAQILRHPQAPSAFTAGLLHDVGKLALLSVAPERYAEMQAYCDENECDSGTGERALGLPTHDAIGLRLAKRWRFPAVLQVPIGRHHTEDPTTDRAVPQNLVPLVDIVGVADALAYRMGYGCGESFQPEMPLASVQRLGLEPGFEEEEKAREQLEENLARSEVLLQLLAG